MLALLKDGDAVLSTTAIPWAALHMGAAGEPRLPAPYSWKLR